MTATPGADELRIRYLLATRGVSYTPHPTPTPPEDPPMQIALLAVIAATVVTAVLLLRRPIARDTTVLAGALLGIAASAAIQSPLSLIAGWLGV